MYNNIIFYIIYIFLCKILIFYCIKIHQNPHIYKQTTKQTCLSNLETIDFAICYVNNGLGNYEKSKKKEKETKENTKKKKRKKGKRYEEKNPGWQSFRDQQLLHLLRKDGSTSALSTTDISPCS